MANLKRKSMEQNKKDIKDYLHLYPEVNWAYYNEMDECYKPTEETFCSIYSKMMKNTSSMYWEEPIFYKPILRPLPDIIDEEQNEFIEVCGLEPEDIDCIKKHPSSFVDGHMVFGTAHLTNILQWSIGTNWLRKKGFDIDNLIESGLAIDKTKL